MVGRLDDFGLDVASGGVRDPEGAWRALADLLNAAPDPESFERLARRLLAGLAHCADADMALANFHRWFGQLGFSLSVQALLSEDELLLANLLTLFATSQYFSDILCRDPSYYEFLADLGALARPRSEEQVRAEVARAVAPFRTYEGRLDALRRAKRREVLRIGVRDVLGLAPFPEVVREISAFADASVYQAYRMAREEVARRFGPLESLEFAVIAMGKLGGGELNYSSDIDLIFVARGEGPHLEAAHRIAERIIQALSRPTAEGYVFRVDMRLRPEGKTGPLVRSLDSYRDYYDHYLENWERQALLKARFVAGEESLGADFHALIAPYVYRPAVPAGMIEELRLNKLRIEKRVEVAGERYTNVKDGYGGIRDIEFTVQLLQLLVGGRYPELRRGDTLGVLAALQQLGFLPAEEVTAISEAYIFFRTVEHRLQIMDERAVRCLPSAADALERLARRLPREWHRDPGAEFTAEYRRRAGTVRSFHRRLFFDPFREAAREDAGDPSISVGELLLALDSAEARQRIRQYLVALGFSSPDRALADLDRLAAGEGAPLAGRPSGAPGAGAASDEGVPPTALHGLGLLARVGPPILEATAASPDPDAALAFVAEMAAAGERRGLLATLGESAFAHDVVCRLGGSAPAIVQALRREPALLDMLFEPEAVVSPPDEAMLRSRLAARVAGAGDHEARLNALRRFKRREMLRIAAADVLAAPDVDEVARQLTLLAQVCVESALELSLAETRAHGNLSGAAQIAVFGLGKVGGREMLYPSDLDLVLVCDLPEGDERVGRYRAYGRVAELFSEAMTRLLPDGDLYPVDFRLRPEGKGGEMVPSLDACRRYYAERAQTWERQAMLKARFLAGDRRVGDAFLGIITPFAYDEGRETEDGGTVGEVRAMKRRIENERTDAATRGRDLKLGPGGLSDVEWLVQLLQLCHGRARPTLRETNTLAALSALAAEGFLSLEETRVLREGYRFQTRLRNLIYLRSGPHVSVLPAGDEDQRALARAMGLDNAGELLEALYGHRERVREIFEREFGR